MVFLAAGLFGMSVAVAITRRRRISSSSDDNSSRGFIRSPEAPDHVELWPPLAANERVLIIGDVHGCLAELLDIVNKADALLDRTLQPPQTLRIITVGDLGNKGPYSAQVVELVRAKGWGCVMGNHDYSAAKLLSSGKGKGWVSLLTPQEKQWLCDLPYSLSIPQLGALVVHAGGYGCAGCVG